MFLFFQNDLQSGLITEVFGCGTAAVIAPVGKFGFQEEEYIIKEESKDGTRFRTGDS